MIVAHRCNLDGPSPGENSMATMLSCISEGFSVELDVRWIDDKVYLGHDFAQEEIPMSLLLAHASSLLIHCKNIPALVQLRNWPSLNIFGHSTDGYVLTSKGDVFCKVGIAEKGCICVMPELYAPGFSREELLECKYIVTDFSRKYRDETNNTLIGKE